MQQASPGNSKQRWKRSGCRADIPDMGQTEQVVPVCPVFWSAMNLDSAERGRVALPVARCVVRVGMHTSQVQTSYIGLSSIRIRLGCIKRSARQATRKSPQFGPVHKWGRATALVDLGVHNQANARSAKPARLRSGTRGFDHILDCAGSSCSPTPEHGRCR